MPSPSKTSYTGEFRHTLDDKNRVTIPSLWRAVHAEGDTFLATPHPDGYVAVLPPAEIEKLHEKISGMILSDGSAQDWAARFFARTQTVQFDKQGRVMLDARLLTHAGITKDAILVGVLTKFHLYSPDHWTRVEERTGGASFGDVMRRLGI